MPIKNNQSYYLKEQTDKKAKSPIAFLESIHITLLLLVCIIALGFALHGTINQDFAPRLPHYSYKNHPNALILCYLPDCGCGVTASDFLRAALPKHYDVCILYEKSYEELDKLPARYPKIQTILVSNKTMERLALFHKTTVVHIVAGRIEARADGVAVIALINSLPSRKNL